MIKEFPTPDSYLFSKVSYHAESGRLMLECRTGKVYEYSDVPEAVFEELRQANPKGRYFMDRIQGKFPQPLRH